MATSTPINNGANKHYTVNVSDTINIATNRSMSGFASPKFNNPVSIKTNPLTEQLSPSNQPQPTTPITNQAPGFSQAIVSQANVLGLNQQDLNYIQRINAGNPQGISQQALREYANAKQILIKDTQNKIDKVLSGQSKSERTLTGEVITKDNLNDFVSSESQQSELINPDMANRIVAGGTNIPINQRLENQGMAAKQGIIDIAKYLNKYIPTSQDIEGLQKNKFGSSLDFQTQLALGQRQSYLNKFTLNKIIKEDRLSQNLQTKLNKISEDVRLGIITPENADATINQLQIDYVREQTKQGIPESLATGLALGILDVALPFIGIPLTTAFLTKAVLDRNAIIQQFKNAPIESSANLAANFAGGLVGLKIGNKITGSATKVEFKPADVEDKGISLMSNEKVNKIINNLKINDKIAYLDVAKSTSTQGVQIKLKDGRVYELVLFNKGLDSTLSPTAQSQTQIIGYELKPGFVNERIGGAIVKKPSLVLGERVLGTGITTKTGDIGESVTQLYRFNPKDLRINKILEKLKLKKPEGLELTILEKSRSMGSRGSFKTGKLTKFESIGRTLEVKNISNNIRNKLESIQRRIEKGQTIPLNEIRNIINLERRLNNERPFTDAEWNNSKNEFLTSGGIVTFINKAKATLTAAEKGVVSGLNIRIKAKTSSLGVASSKTKTLTEKESARIATRERLRKFDEKRLKIKKETNLKTPPSQFGKAKAVSILKQGLKNLNKSLSLGVVAGLGKVKPTILKSKPSSIKAISKPVIKSYKVRESEFAGTGLYERTSETAIPNWNKKADSLGSQTPARTSMESKIKDKVKSESKSEFKNLTKSGLAYNIAQRMRDKIKEEVRAKVRLETSQASRERLEFGQTRRLNFREIAKPKLRVPPRTPPIKPIIGISQQKRKSEFKDLRKTGFDTFVKNRGKFERVNPRPFATKEQALGFGFKSAKGVLGRSVVAVPTGRQKPFSSTAAKAEFNKLSSEFRASKRFGSKVQIQKNPLSTKRETTLIQETRKIRGVRPIRSIL